MTARVLIIYNDSVIKYRRTLITKLEDRGCEVFALTNDKKFDPNYKNHYYWNLDSGSVRLRKEIKSIVEIYKTVVRLRPEVVICFGFKASYYMALLKVLILKKNLRKCNFFPVFTGLPFGSYLIDHTRSLKSYFMQAIIGTIYWIIGIYSNFVFVQNKDDLICLRPWIKNNLRLMDSSGVSIKHAHHENMQKKDFSRLQVYFAGRFVKSKGILRYLELVELCKNSSKLEFHLYGGVDNNPNSIDIRIIDKLSTYSNFYFHGYVDRLSERCRQHHVIVYPSNYFEGVPRVLLEALAASNIVIAKDWRGNRETVNNSNGFIYDFKDINVAKEKLVWLKENPHKMKEMMSGSYDIVTKRFDENLVLDQFIQEILSDVT